MWAASQNWKGQGEDPPLGLPEECSPADTLILAALQTSDLQNCKIINL